jgi:ATP-binding cassette, subfamily B, bacterial MsbA
LPAARATIYMPTLLQRFARVSPYLKTGRLGLLAAGLGAIVGAATEPLIPALMKPLFDRGFKAGELALWWIPVAIIGLFTVRGLAGFVAQYGLSWAANKAVLQMRREMFDRLMTARPALFGKHTTTSLLNTLVYETQSGTMQLVSALLTVVKDSLTLVALLGYLLWLNWQLTLFVAILFPSVALVMRVLGKRLHRLTVDGQKATDELGYIVEENVLAWRIVRLHGAAPVQSARFYQRGDLLRRLVMKSVVASATMTPVTQIMAACTLSAVVVVALWQSTSSGGSVGSFVAFITAMLMIIAPIKHLADVMAPITRGLAAVERGLDLIDASPIEEGGTHDSGRARGDIELRGVTVRYRDDPDAALALDQVTLRVRAGEAVAFVGPSGAGKSTLVHLLPRFIEPTTGDILLDGVPIRDWDVRALRRQFALVSQDVVLFNDTVAANVALGIGNGDAAERERVKDALRAANLLEFAEGLPMGIDTPIGHNGNQLSGGQRQRLAIARAIYKDAPVLILDEATSALDSESERAVQAALERLMVGRTSLVIAHRLSTIENANRVVALDAGRLVEQGSHAELLAAGGLYARLHAMQFRT